MAIWPCKSGHLATLAIFGGRMAVKSPHNGSTNYPRVVHVVYMLQLVPLGIEYIILKIPGGKYQGNRIFEYE